MRIRTLVRHAAHLTWLFGKPSYQGRAFLVVISVATLIMDFRTLDHPESRDPDLLPANDKTFALI